MNIGKAIYDIRKLRGYTQDELSKMINISQSSITAFETGKKFPSRLTIEIIAKGLRAPIGVFYLAAFEEEDFFPGSTNTKSALLEVITTLAKKQLNKLP